MFTAFLNSLRNSSLHFWLIVFFAVLFFVMGCATRVVDEGVDVKVRDEKNWEKSTP